MARRHGRAAKKARISGAGADRLTGLPLELRAHIVSYLSYAEAARISALSRAWRGLHKHTAVVKVNLDDFLYLEDYIFDKADDAPPGILDDGALLGLRGDLSRRDREGSTVDMLRLTYRARDPRTKRHADRIIALADAPRMRLSSPYGRAEDPATWAVDLPPRARELHLVSLDRLTPAITGPSVASLRELQLQAIELREWSSLLPSLRSLMLNDVTIQAPYTIFSYRMEHERVDIRLSRLKSLELDDFNINPPNQDGRPFADVTIVAPMLEELDVNCTTGSIVEFRSFTLRAPRLRWMLWDGQFAERVRIDAGRPASVRSGKITFAANGEHEEVWRPGMKLYRAQMMRMLEGLLPDVPREHVGDVARSVPESSHVHHHSEFSTPSRQSSSIYAVDMAVDNKSVWDGDLGRMIPEETITCNLRGLMASLDV